jgi:uncharacterized membrane protein
MTVMDRTPGSVGGEVEEVRARWVVTRVRAWYAVMMVAALAGVTSGMVVIVDKINYLKDPAAGSFCDVSSTVGCTPVLKAWQSSVLGPPNAAIGIVLFGMLAVVGLAGVMGTAFPPRFLAAMYGLDIFFLLFLTWYMTQVAFSIRSLCPFCVACTGALLVVTLAMNRVSVAGRACGEGRLGRALDTATRDGIDVMVVVGWGLAVAGMLWVGIFL